MNRLQKFSILCVLVLTVAIALLFPQFVEAQSGQTHTVQPGETLYSIALKYNTTTTAIAFANGITNPNLIFAGQSLVIPGTSSSGSGSPAGSSTYTVKSGDTLYSIARQFGITIDTLVSLNGISNPNFIYVGQVLKVSGQVTVPTATRQPTRIPTSNPTARPTATRTPSAVATIRPTATAVSSQTQVIHTVQAGETLYLIAIKYNTSVQQIVQLNNITNPNLIYVGQNLIITSGGFTPIPTATRTTSVSPTATQSGSTGTIFSTPTPIVSSVTIPSSAPNRITNGSFDGATRNIFYDTVKVVTGWEPFYCAAPYVSSGCISPEGSSDSNGSMGRPVYGVTSQSGSSKSGQAQYWSCNSDTCRAGIFQTIATTPGATCRAGAFVKSWSAPSGSLASTARYNSYWFIRVDTSGGTAAFATSPALLLSRAFDIEDGHYDQFIEISYTFQAIGTRTTVFFENLRREPQANNFSYIDSAYVVCSN